MSSNDSLLRKVVVLGSGWGALSFVRKLDPSAFDVPGLVFRSVLNELLNGIRNT